MRDENRDENPGDEPQTNRTDTTQESSLSEIRAPNGAGDGDFF